jgi:cation diffusion facilitator CzcD-associated flavoprotein CzcO
MSASKPVEVWDTLIIGAGFGGLAMAIRLKKAGLTKFVVLERAPDAGGVWWSNAYPGAACDVESRLYSYSFAQDFEWTRSHGEREEIQNYFRHCIKKFDLAPHLRFGVTVEEAVYDLARGAWTERTGDGATHEARTLVSACGLFNTASIPEIPGAETFGGRAFHSSNWDHAFDFEGKRVAVIGTGCSAAQFVPIIAKQVQSLTVFQRTAAWVSAKPEPMDRPIHRFLMRSALMRRFDRWRTYIQYERGYVVQTNPVVRAAREKAALAFLASQVKDETKREKLTPKIAIGCKRNIRSSDLLATLDQPHVGIVTASIDHIDGDGIVTSDGSRHDVDALIYGTGFTTTRFLSTLRIVGAKGESLDEAWKGTPEAYLGVTVAGFPNFFIMYGPNTNAPSSIVFMIECQANYILQAIRRIVSGRARALDVRAETQASFNEEVQAELRGRAWTTGCKSYFMNAAGRIVTQWHKPSRHYWWRTLRFNPADYRIER